MDRGIPSEEQLAQLRAMKPPVLYLVGTPRARVRETNDQWEKLAWQKIKDTVEVKLFSQEQELYVVAKSQGRQEKEKAIRRRKLARLLWSLRAMRRKETKRDRLLMRLGAAQARAGRAARFVEVRLPKEGEAVDRQSFAFQLNHDRLEEAELYDGHYLLRSNLTDKEPQWLWKLYILLVEIEAVFKSFKNDLKLRPIFHSRTEG